MRFKESIKEFYYPANMNSKRGGWKKQRGENYHMILQENIVELKDTPIYIEKDPFEYPAQ